MRPNSQRGQVYPLFAIMLTVLMGISALSVDMGYYRYQQRLQQAATDSAAVAAAQASFYDSKNSANSTNAAIDAAGKNGFTNGSGNVTVVLNKGYKDTGNCTNGCIQVKITKKYPIFFGSVFPHYAQSKSDDTRSISTYAAASLQSVAGACLTSLGTNPTSSTSNGAKVDGADCGIADADCTTVDGGTNVTIGSWAVNAACAGSNTWNGGTSQFIPSIAPVDPCSVSDQCKNLATATPAELGLTSLSAPSCTAAALTTVKATDPQTGGCYNSPDFSGHTLGKGLYVIVGTASFNGNVTGTAGVTFYFTAGAKYADKTNANVNLSAPASGTGDFVAGASGNGQEGILMYQTSSSTKWAANVKANITWSGLAYMPNWDVDFKGHSESITGNFTTDSFTIDGGSSLVLDPGSGTPSGDPLAVVLAE